LEAINIINRYAKGRRKEYAIIREEKAMGYIAFRSAGSHSPIDIVSIDTRAKVILLIQAKSGLSPAALQRLEEQHEELNGTYMVHFQCRG
jgi:Holliday junction resolvase